MSTALHAVAAVRPDDVIRINLPRNDSDVKMVFGAFPPVWTLAKGAGADLISCGTFRVLPDTEESARLLALASNFLENCKISGQFLIGINVHSCQYLVINWVPNASMHHSKQG